MRLSVYLLPFLFVAVVAANAPSYAGSYQFDLTQMADLDHYRYYEWGTDWNTNCDITKATLTFKNIWDWKVEDGDHLYVHLMDTMAPGLRSYWDGEGGGDAFDGQGVLIADWTDPVGGTARNFDLVVEIAPENLDLLYNGFGFGIDPDCHYYNDGIVLDIEATPEPATFILLGVTGGVLGLIRRRRR